MPEKSELDRFFLRSVFTLLLLYLVWLNLYLIVLVLIAVILAAALLPLADAAEKRRIPRLATVGVVYVAGAGVVTLLISMLVPVVLTQGQMVIDNLQGFQDQLQARLQHGVAYLGRFEWASDLRVPSLGADQIAPFLQGLAQKSYVATRGVLSGAIGVLIVLFVAAYFVIDARRIALGLMAFVPPSRRGRAEAIGALVLQRMGAYIRGQICVCAFVGLFMAVGLSAMRLDSALLVALVAGVFNIVPYVGTALSLILALLLALNVSAWTVLGVLILFGVEQFLEGNFVSPYFLSRQVEMHPLAVMGALVVGANLAGILGAMVAVPLAAGVNVLAQEMYVKPRGAR